MISITEKELSVLFFAGSLLLLMNISKRLEGGCSEKTASGVKIFFSGGKGHA